MAVEVTSFREQFQNAQTTLSDITRRLFTETKRGVKFATPAATKMDVEGIFRTRNPEENVLAALALPLVLQYVPYGDANAERQKSEPWKTQRSRFALLQRVACVCRSLSVVVRLARDSVIARWTETVVPRAFRDKQARYLRQCERVLMLFTVCKQRARNRKARRTEMYAFKFSMEGVTQLRRHGSEFVVCACVYVLIGF
jgi:hypothetical protein